MANNTGFSDSNIDMKEVQNVQLEILLEFDRICKNNNIQYSLYAGTLLGAIRHKGFIPWDDDIDVCMLREEYDKLLAVYSKQLEDKYFLQTYETDKGYQHQFAKLRKNNTLYIEKNLSDVDIHQGIFIDVFPYDNIRPNKISGEIHRITLNILRIINGSASKELNYSVDSKLKRIVRMCMYYIHKIFPKFVKDRFNTKVACVFNNKKTKYVGELALSTTRNLYRKFSLKRSAFDDIIEWEFEGHMLPVPREYDEVLTRHYGDYMTLPPVDQQQPHHDIVMVSTDTTKSS